MKKQFSIITSILVAMIFFSYSAVAQKIHTQQVIQKAEISSQNAPLSEINGINNSNAENKNINAVIWSDDFSTPANWTIASEIPNTDNWVIGTSGPSGSFAIAPIASTTAANGFALFDSDKMCSGNQIGDITNATAINCTGHTLVALKFQQYYRRWYDSTFVFVSNNGSTWTKFRVNKSVAINGYSGPNPTNTTINISSVAANQATVWVRFQFWSPSSLGANAGCGYAWMIDDVSLVDLAQYDVALTASSNPNEYVIKPIAQYTSSPLTLSATVENVGASAVTNVNMTVNIYNLSTMTLAHTTGSNSLASLASFTTGTLTASTSYSPPVDTAIYLIEYIAHMTQTDGDNSNDTLYRGFWVNDSIYARSDEQFTAELDNALGFGAGTYGLLGSDFTLSVADKLTSIRAYVTGPVVGDTTQFFVYSTTASGLPSAQIGSSAIYKFTTAGGQWVNLPLSGGPLSLAAGTYYVAIKEFTATSNIGVGFTDNNYTAIKSYIKIGTAAFDTLDNYSYYGAFIIEPSFYCASFMTDITATEDTICQGASTTLTALNGQTYNWSSGGTNASITVSPTVNTVYTVTTTNKYGCTDTDNFTIVVKPFSATATATTPAICNGSCTNVTATGGGTYIWSNPPGGTANPINVCPTTTTTYTVTVTAVNGCTGVASATVTVNPVPTADAGTDVTICSGSSTTLNATGGTSYAWSPATGLSCTSCANPTANPTTTSTYTVTVSNGTCTATDAVTVTVNPAPTADAGTNQSIPTGTSTTLSGSASGGTAPYNYLWAPSGSLVAANVQNPTTTNLTSTTVYTLTVTDASGCSSTDQVTVSVTGGVLSVTCPVASTICPGSCSTLGTLVSGGSAPYTYLWSSTPTDATLTGHETEAGPTVCPTVTTLYSLTVTDATPSSAACSFTLTVDSPMSTDTTVVPEICGNNDGSATVTVTGGTGPYTYTWSNSQTTQTATGLAAGTYAVTVTDAAGCTAATSAVVNCTVGIHENTSSANISIAPNPSDGSFIMTIAGYEGKNAVVTICSMKGQTLYSEKLNVSTGNYTEKMNLRDLGQGVYIIKVISQGSVKTARLIIE